MSNAAAPPISGLGMLSAAALTASGMPVANGSTNGAVAGYGAPRQGLVASPIVASAAARAPQLQVQPERRPQQLARQQPLPQALAVSQPPPTMMRTLLNTSVGSHQNRYGSVAAAAYSAAARPIQSVQPVRPVHTQPIQYQYAPPARPLTAQSTKPAASVVAVQRPQITSQPQSRSVPSVLAPSSPVKVLSSILTRPSLTQSWGLQISLFDDAYLIVGCADETKVRALSTHGKVGDYKYKSAAMLGAADVQNSHLGGSSCSVSAPILLPYLQSGDMILSLNGRAISSFSPQSQATNAHSSNGSANQGETFQNLVSYLRTQSTVTILALRCESSWRASATALIGGSVLVAQHGSVGGSANAAQRNREVRDCIKRSAVGSLDCLARVLGLPRKKDAIAAGVGAGRSRSITSRSSSYQRPYRGPTIDQHFPTWLRTRKATWRRHRFPVSRRLAEFAAPPQIRKRPRPMEPYDPLDGTRAGQYLNPEMEEDFDGWLQKRKKTWRAGWPVARRMAEFGEGEEAKIDNEGGDEQDEEGVVLRSDFWTLNGHATFADWLSAKKAHWTQDYSWNAAKRRRIERDADVVVWLPRPSDCHDDEEMHEKFNRWLGVRKNQWRLLRRKMQRQRAEEAAAVASSEAAGRRREATTSSVDGDRKRSALPTSGDETPTKKKRKGESTSRIESPDSVARLPARPFFGQGRSTSTELALIDSILEEEERKRQELEDREPLDISFIFDSKIGCPDDAVVKILSYLPVAEHHRFLCISYETSMAIRQRDYLWRSLCPSRWTLPRRPRTPWFKFYITKIRVEEETYRKEGDVVLLKACPIIEKADHLQKLQKLIRTTRKRGVHFDVNYISGVVCERNSLLNLAIINGRHKIVRYLIETENADIETVDRGNFSPLLNAAWNGDTRLVRYLLGRGANRKLVGLYHSSKGISPSDFKGHTAEGWARERGHTQIADLIRLGL